MDTSKYIKKCPNCGTEIEPYRIATTGDKVVAGLGGAGGAIAGFALGGPIGAVIGGAITYAIGKSNLMDNDDNCSESQLFKYECSNCGYTWEQKIHTNDNPDDPSMTGFPY